MTAPLDSPPPHRPADGPAPKSATLGLSQWFHYGDVEGVRRVRGLLDELGCRHLRCGVSWADFVRPDGEAWYRTQFRELAGLDLLVCVNFTPPSVSKGNSCNSPPKRLDDFGDWVAQILRLYGEHIGAVELWNEPNVPVYWDYHNWDADFRSIALMTAHAAKECRAAGVPAVMGGISSVNGGYLGWLRNWGALDELDVLAVHQFPGMWWPGRAAWTLPRDFRGEWPGTMRQLRRHAGRPDGTARPCWVTETGFATFDPAANAPALYEEQCDRLRAAAACPAERVYWYSVEDLDPRRDAVEGFHEEEPEYHLGLVTFPEAGRSGTKKPAWHVMKELLEERGRA